MFWQERSGNEQLTSLSGEGYIIKIHIYSNMRCVLQGILVDFQSLRSSFDTILMFNYWIGHCCKSLKKVLNFTKMMTHEPKNAQNVCEKYLMLQFIYLQECHGDLKW